MVKRNSILKKTVLLLTLTVVLSSLAACENTKNTDSSVSNNEVSQSSNESVIEEKNYNYTQTELTEQEKVPVYTYSSDKYYHLTTDCRGEDEEAMVLLRKPAENCGYSPCPKCADGTE